MTLTAGNDVGCEPKDPKAKIPEPFWGLTIGRIVHVCLILPTAEQPLVERPAIITTVKCFERGIISAHIFMSPLDPPGEIIVHQGGQEGIPLGAELHYFDHPKQPHQAWTWHWPERV